MKFSILDIYCKEHLYYVNQTLLENIMAGSSLLENIKANWNKKQNETFNIDIPL